MSQKSIFWPTGTSGDGAAAYTEAETTRLFKSLTGGNPDIEGVLFEVDSNLAVTGSSSPLSVNIGSAFVNGYFYWNTAPENVVVTTPIVGTTGGRVVLQMITANKTVRIALIMSSDGVSGYPALTQTDNVKWEIPLANFTITTGGAITLTDARGFIHMPTKVSNSMLDSASVTLAKMAANSVDVSQIVNDAVDNTKLRDSPALSVIGRASNSIGNPNDITAGVDGQILRRAGTALDFGQIVAAGITDATITEAKLAAAVTGKLVTGGDSHDHSGGDGAQVPTGGIANDAVDDTKAGNRVPQFYRRKGGDAALWAVPGSTNYTPGAVRIQGGSVDSVAGALSVTFPVAFTGTPLLVIFPIDTWAVTVLTSSRSSTDFSFRVLNSSGTDVIGVTVHWIAIGAE